jgi:hypothetical protein
MKSEPRKQLLLISLLVGLIMFGLGNYFSLVAPVPSRADSFDFWRGEVNEKLKSGEDRDRGVSQKLDSIEKKIESICADITDVKIQAAKNGALYGMGSSIISYLVGLLIQTLARRRNGGGGK